MSVTKFTDLVAYFDKLCRQNVDIAHSDEEPHFFRYELDDVLTSLSNDVNYKAFILESYDSSFSDANADNLLKNRSTAFMIIDHVADKTDMDAIHRAWDECEAIGDEFIVKMMADKKSRKEPIIRTFDVNEVEVHTLANDSKGYYGVRYAFAIGSSRTNEPDPEKWNDN